MFNYTFDYTFNFTFTQYDLRLYNMTIRQQIEKQKKNTYRKLLIVTTTLKLRDLKIHTKFYCRNNEL